MKLAKLLLFLASGVIVVWILFSIDLWAGEWKDLFFYQDNWLFYIFLAVMALIVGMIIKKLFVIEYKLLK
ncbi:MAG: hypothetical protein WC821_03985 [archaeon]|jgi:uncharacterized membrane protein YcjF (UPF0283 family)